MNGGAPAFANPQSMYLFPFDLLFAVLPLDRATNLVILLDTLLAGLAMYLFSRGFLRHPGSALFCALAYMLSYRYLAMIHAGWLPKMSMVALVPLLFWSCGRILREPGAGGRVAFSAAVALGLLQGDMQQLYFAGIGCLLFGLAALRGLPRADRPRAFLWWCAAGALGAMLAAPALLPRLELAALSTRTELGYGFFLSGPPALADLATFLDPADRGGLRPEFWENNFYFGIWLLPLWACAFWDHGKRALWVALAVLAMVFLCFDTPVLKLLYHALPGFDLFRKSSRILLLAQFAAVLLAGLGVDALLARLPGAGAGRLAAAIGLLCALPIADAAVRIRPTIATAPLERAFPEHELHRRLHRSRAGGRVLAIGRTAIPYGMAGYYGIDLVNGYASLTLRHFAEYFSVLQSGSREGLPDRPVLWTDVRRLERPDLLRALDVRTLVANRSHPLERLGYRRVASYPEVPVFRFYHGHEKLPVEVWRLERPLGAAYFATSVRAVADETQSLDALVESRSPREARVLGLDRDLRDLDLAGGEAEMVRRGIDRYQYRIESRGENFLILSQIWYPGWWAALDGEEIELYRTNHALLGCFVPPGRHRLALEMRSAPLRWGTALAAAAAAVLVALPLAARGRTA